MPAPVQVVLCAVFTTHQPTHGCTLHTGSVTDQTDGEGTAVYVTQKIKLEFAHRKPFDDAEAFLEISCGNVMQKFHLNKEKSDASKLAKLIDSTTKQVRKSYEQQKMPPLVSSAVVSDGWPIQVNLYLEDGGIYTMVGPSEWQNTASVHIMIAMAIGDTVKSCAEMELYGVTNTQCNVVPIARICVGKHVAYLPVSWVTFEEVPSYAVLLGNQVAKRLKCLQDWHASDILNLYLEDAQEQDTVMKQPSEDWQASDIHTDVEDVQEQDTVMKQPSGERVRKRVTFSDPLQLSKEPLPPSKKAKTVKPHSKKAKTVKPHSKKAKTVKRRKK